MNILVLGGTGATGSWVIKHLLKSGHSVVVLARSNETLTKHERLDFIKGSALSISQGALTSLLDANEAVISCLGHNLTWKGVYGAPRMLVRDSIQRICECASIKRVRPLRIVLMNTTGNRNRDLPEPISLAQHGVLWLLRALLPPHVDNERAANYLRVKQCNNPALEWVVVRPDALIDDAEITPFTLHSSPIRSAIFNSGTTSRINAAHIMSQLVVDETLWERWQGKMPVIYNQETG